MIEIRQSDQDSESEATSYNLVIDGIPIDKDAANVLTLGDGEFWIFSKNPTTSEVIAAYSLNEMAQVTHLQMTYRFDWFSSIDKIIIVSMNKADEERKNEESRERNYLALINFGHFSEWRGTYSFDDYFLELIRIINSNEDLGISPVKSVDLAVDIPTSFLLAGEPYVLSLGSISAEPPLTSEISRLSDIFRRLHDEVEKALSTISHGNVVSMSFDFPEEVRVSCEQYLLYFGKFLQDLGVQATSDLRHEAGQVLFTVTPDDSQIALDKIRAALDVYLQLPTSPVTDSTHSEIAIQRLESNIYRLKSDLKLAAAELQAKNTTIEAQRLIIDTQKGLLSGEIMLTSMKDVTPKPADQDKEEIIKDTLSIIPYKGKGIEVNLPEIFRRLKKLFMED